MRKQILIVDDEPDTLNLLAEVLAAEGYRVLQTLDGQEALDLCEREHPDLVLLDLMMPGLDGFDVALRLQSRMGEVSIPIVVLTAQPGLREKIEQGRERFGVTKVIEKPFRLVEMVAEVKRVLAQAAGGAEARPA